MRATWLSALAIVAVLGTSGQLYAQRGPIGTSSSGAPAARPVGARPASGRREPALPVRRPFGTLTTVPRRAGGDVNRICVLRSPILGLFAFDPDLLLAPDEIHEGLPGPPPGPRPPAGLQLDVEPRRALVYLDGIFIGPVDQFKGYFQHLETTAGYHVVEFITPDYDPLIVELNAVPNKTTVYRASLNRASGR